MNGSISHGSEYYLCIRVEAYFYGWCNANPDFGIWSEEMAQLKSLCLVLSGSVNSKAAYWPNTSSWQIIAAGHTQTSARLGEISHFEFHICFKYIGHMASSTKKCDHETSSFCVAFGSLGFFLTSTFPALKHHQPCILLQSASQLQLQHWCLWNNETSKTAGLCIGVEASFYGWCNANPDFWIWSE